MKITSLETLRVDFQPNLVLLQLHTDEGLVGLGEAFYASATVESYLHDVVAPALAGFEDPGPERVARHLAPYVGFQGGGVEVRGNGAVDLALWDLLGKRSDLPVVDLLGGAVHKQVKIYNTCAGPGYVSTSTRQESANWGMSSRDAHQDYEHLEDLDAFLRRPGELAMELRDEGIRGMKVWPFDAGAERTGGTRIELDDLRRGLAVIEAIRDAVGLDLDLMVELHGLWNRPTATEICRAIAPYKPFWVEDPIRADGVDALARLADDVDVTIAVGETCIGRRGYLPLLQRGAVDVITVDVQWTGGLTEARKVATLADAYGVPIAPHDCTGPITLAACVALVSSQPNGLVQETVRAFLRTWYADVAAGLPEISEGSITSSTEPGLGVRLHDDLADRPGVTRRITRL